MPIRPGCNTCKLINSALYCRYSTPMFALLLSLVLCLNQAASAQTSENLRFERYTIDQGLSSDRTKSITQDDFGYIWIATESGLSRYDGYDIAVYRNSPADPSSLSNNNAYVVHTDRFGVVWAGTSLGLNRYNTVTDSFVRYYHDPENDISLPGNSIQDIFESDSGELWFGTDNGLALYNRETDQFRSQWGHPGGENVLSGVVVTSVTEARSGTLWIGTNGNGLITFNLLDEQFHFLDQKPFPGISLPSNTISKVFADSNGDIWIGFIPDIQDGMNEYFIYGNPKAGLARLNPATNDFDLYRYHPEKQPGIWDYVSDIIETEDGTIWIGTYNSNLFSGIHRYDRQAETFTRFSYDPFRSTSLTWAYVQALFEDRFKNLWVGTSRGINKADISKWQMGAFQARPDDPYNFDNNFYGIEEVDDDLIWFGLDGDGVLEWDRATNSIVKYGVENTNEQPGHESLAGRLMIIKKDRLGEVWLGYAGAGVIRINRQTQKRDRFFPSSNDTTTLIGNYVSGILVDRSNTVWIATSNGLSRFNRNDETFTSWQKNEERGLHSNSLNSIFEDSRGYIWIGTKEHVFDFQPTRSDGLIKFDPATEQFTSYKHNPNNRNSLGNDAIYEIQEDDKGYLWIATGNGLDRFDPVEETFRHYNVREGLPHPVISGLLFDDDGMLWLSTLKGLSRFDTATETFRNYGKDDGILANRFNDYSYLKTSSGELIFGGVAGANHFNPSEKTGNLVEPAVLITSFLVNNSIYQLDEHLMGAETVTLDWNDNSVGYEFIAITFRSSHLTEYEYKLEGYDADWISSGTRRYANYTNLPSGNYTFNVRAVNAEGIRSTVNATMAIRIQPPFWDTWWAYGLYLILFITGIVTIDRVQRRRVQQKERKKAREKELEQAKQIEIAYENLKTAQDQLVQQEKLASLGQLTAGIAHEIKNPLNFVNNFSDVSLEMIDEALGELAKTSQDDHTAETAAILADIKSNLAKIHEHGSRADGIVKSMLMHSRGGTGKMEPTNLNELVKEYVNLSYHGMRAGKDPIDVDIDLQLDESIGEIPLIAEDFSRVILNLCTNALDACAERIRGSFERGSLESLPQSPGGSSENLPQSGSPRRVPPDHTPPPPYTPRLTIRTGKNNGTITIEIEDNGPGIPDEIKDKILQPFFTTKKGTQGTGLGLSITNDIIKAHGGKIEIKSLPGEGSTFTIQLPKQGL